MFILSLLKVKKLTVSFFPDRIAEWMDGDKKAKKAGFKNVHSSISINITFLRHVCTRPLDHEAGFTVQRDHYFPEECVQSALIMGGFLIFNETKINMFISEKKVFFFCSYFGSPF